MIKDNQKTFNRIHVIIDGCLLVLSYVVSYFLRFYTPLREIFKLEPSTRFLSLQQYTQILIFLIPGYLIIYYLCNLYAPKRDQSTRVSLWNIVKANFLGTFYFTFLLYAVKEINYSRYMIAIFFIVNVIFNASFRAVLTYSLKTARRKGYNLKHVVLVGYSRAAEAYIDRILVNPQWGYYIHGILDDTMERGTLYKNIKVIGSIDDLLEILPQNRLDEIAITLSIDEYSKLGRIVGVCEKSGVHTKFIPDYQNFFPTVPYTEDLDGLPVINIRNVPLSNTVNRFLKRIIDIIGCIAALIVFSIPMTVVAIIIKVTSPGPVIFTQVRIGRHNKEFKMYKFRSMEVQTDTKEKKAWTTFNDPRVTKIGKLIRRTSIDELPQLFNVLKGEMSLVGPRPERPFFVDKFKEEIPRYMIKHQVQPGMTGWAQIKGFRGDTSIRKRIECDLYYIENWTIALDIKILFFTVFNGFINKNAY
ncbi:undecaprenyl-phosphate glucose phosphotransferase [Anaerocolumna sp. AGMB13025]|uniref:undecaprenyl-phosphate glucose phosphotransferase n=1 Tax=Anaerocolumna sp. AGMB13025 TaxID=3039116 RepID=UPI00241CC67F|nr:undecaprenyl-phosphate glucose phosphotransferase [Anaerocolumna sp. AGMB13025]WFR58197.1 undecaprenyl-phosphate glucose phosphotransferase [Anaerocolumna sp. AGMB13025]